MNFVLPPAFTLAHYRLTLEALEPLHLPPFKGSALRGGFGHTFKRLVCFFPKGTYGQPWPCGDRCALGNACPYGYVFETAPPTDAEVLRTFSEAPRPFVIEPPDDRRTLIPAGERLSFGLTLVGRGINYLPYFIAVFRELGKVGLGRTRGKYRLLRMDAVTPSPYEGEGRGGGGTHPIYQAQEERIHPANSTITADAITAYAATLTPAPRPLRSPAPTPPDRLTLEFLTPTRLKHQGRWVRQGPPFPVLVKALLGRVSSLSYFHCSQRWQTDFRGLIQQAAEVRIVRRETHWQDWSRFSGRQKQRVQMGGLVGRVTYEGELQAYLPLLALGEWIHAGKGTVFGNGQYQIAMGDSDREGG